MGIEDIPNSDEARQEVQQESHEAYGQMHDEIVAELHAMIRDEIEEAQLKEDVRLGAGTLTLVAGTVAAAVAFWLTKDINSLAAASVAPAVFAGGMATGLGFNMAAKSAAKEKAYLTGVMEMEDPRAIEYLYHGRHTEALTSAREKIDEELQTLKEGGTIRRLVRKCLPPSLDARLAPAALEGEAAERAQALEEQADELSERAAAASGSRDQVLREWLQENGTTLDADVLPTADDHALYENAIRDYVERMTSVQEEQQDIDAEYAPKKKPNVAGGLAAGLIVGSSVARSSQHHE
jgi:hypothetical protein